MMGSQPVPISDRLRKLREDKNLTQQALAVMAGVAVSLVTKIEQGTTPDPRWSSIVKLAAALGVSIDEFKDPT